MKTTYIQKPAEVERKWHLMDAQDQILGKLAVEIAKKLLGKDKPTFTSHVDGGDFVVVVNASKVKVTRGKENKKMYYRHSQYMGGLREETFAQVMEINPARVIELAVKNMLPKNKLRDDRMARLKVYADAEHKHQSQLTNTK